MKSLKSACFAVGMTGMFSMAVPRQMEWLASLPVIQSCAAAVLLSAACAVLLSWLTQFRRRHIGSPGLLYGFAAAGLLATLMLPVGALELVPATMDNTLAAILRIALLALFCLVAVKTQPASEQVEGAL